MTRRISAETGSNGRFSFGPLIPGPWYLTVEAAGHPAIEDGPIELQAKGLQDVGVIRVVVGGTLHLQILSGDPSGVQFQAQGREGSASSSGFRLGPGEVSGPLMAQGDDELVVFGDDTAEQTVPFTIHPAEDTHLERQLARGVHQSFEIAVPVDAAPAGRVQLLVQRGDETIRRRSLPAGRDAAWRKSEAWFAPGSYTLSASCGTLLAAVPFRVGTEEGAPLWVDLQ